MSLTTYDISGMHCASCVGRVERTLRALPDVTLARVNLALEEAIVEGLPDAAAEARVAQAIIDSGYKAKIKVAGAGRQEQVERRQSQVRTLGLQTLIAGLFTFPVFVIEMGGHMYPPMHHWVTSTFGQTNSWFAQFLLITLVMIWPGRSFYTLGLPNLFRGAPDMNALVAIGTLAAWGYSVVSLFSPSLLPMGNLAVYFEAAGVIILSAAIAGFLVLNFPFGKIFLGDAGAYALGHLLVWTSISILWNAPSVTPLAVLLIFFWPIADTVMAILRRYSAGKSITQPDRLHFHQLVMRAVEIVLLGRNKRKLANPLATTLTIPFVISPMIAGVLFAYDPRNAAIACVFFGGVFFVTYKVGMWLAPKLRRSHRLPSKGAVRVYQTD